ncbi:MAG: hypothetical protein GKR87_10735 [Kiritimatiellae bacterium]|nr:hypothetical protein [Kiritimatiellia bacterium]
MFFVIADGYIYLVPHKRIKNIFFLKAIIPNRKATKDYTIELEGKDERETTLKKRIK